LEQVRKGFPKSTAHELEKMILREIDRRNIINAYRMKAYFGFSAEEIKRRTLKFSGIGNKRIEKLYECETAQQMLEMTEKTVYGRNSVQTDNIEVKINSVNYRYLRSKLADSVDAPVALYAFVQLCDIDVQNIIHIIEGIRYGADTALIEAQLITL
jgi:V/A-type H+-transporting ATPase subunit C